MAGFDEVPTPVGRSEEIGYLVRALEPSEVVLLVTGGPGIGKTSVAREVARQWCRAASRRCRWVDALSADLYSDDEPGDRVLVAPEPVAAEGAEAETEWLIVLDGAWDWSVAQVAKLAAQTAVGRSRVLVTSRRAVSYSNVETVRLTPLSQAASFELISGESTRRGNREELRLERVQPLLELLDGCPLALVLAASHLPALSCSALVDGLRSVYALEASRHGGTADGHHSLDQALEASWERLDEESRDALWVLALVGGAFDAALAFELLRVCGIGSPGTALRVLREHCLVEAHESADGRPWFFLFRFVLEGACRRASPRIEPRTVRRLALRIVASRSSATGVPSASSGTPENLGIGRVTLLSLFEEFADDAADDVVSLADRLCWWIIPDIEGLDRALTRIGNHAGSTTACRTTAWLALGRVMRELNRLNRARDAASRALALAEGEGMESLRARALSLLGLVSALCGEVSLGETLSNEALDLAGRTGDSRALGPAFAARGLVGALRGGWVQPMADLEQAAGFFYEIHDRIEEGRAYRILASAHIQRLDIRAAHQWLDRAARCVHEHPDRLAEARVRQLRGFVHAMMSHHSEALDDLAFALQVHEEKRNLLGVDSIHLTLGYVYQDLGDWDTAEWHYHESIRVAGTGVRRTEAIAVCQSGVLALEQGDALAAEERLDRGLTLLELLSEERLVSIYAAFRSEAALRSSQRPLREYWLSRARERSDDPSATGLVGIFTQRNSQTHADAWRSLFHRTALRIRAMTDATTPRATQTLTVGPEGRWFRLGDGERVDLARRRSVARILHLLARHSTGQHEAGVTTDDLIAIGWPGERILPRPAQNRVYAAIHMLRKLGLEGALVCDEAGYRLEAFVTLAEQS
ncbi:MAG: hypothetical protein KGO50_05975 [Myxococcales bacterium]|nr:hypothetical protein [Myxococcales bacterium]